MVSKLEIVTMKFWIIVALAAVATAQDLPKELKICKRSDPDYNACMAQAVEESLKFFKDGNKALGMLPIDPYLIESAATNHTSGNSNFNLRSSLTNNDFNGLSTPMVKRLKFKFDDAFAARVEGKFNVLQLIGDYTMNGKIFVLPISGVGRCNITMLNVTALVDMRGPYVTKNGEKYIHLDYFKMRINPQRSFFKFDNIFNGDKTLSDQINLFMNENHEVVIATLLPGYLDIMGNKFKDIANSLFDKIPMKFIFPE